MTNDLVLANKARVTCASARKSFDQTSIMFHWITVLLIVVQFASIWVRESLSHQSELAAILLTLHRTTGTLTFVVVALRLVWRRYWAYLPAFPATMPIVQQFAAKANEYALYFLLPRCPSPGLHASFYEGSPSNYWPGKCQP